MSTATRESPGKGPGPPPMHVIERMEDVTVGMRVEAKDSYGKWYVCIQYEWYASPCVCIHVCVCVYVCVKVLC